MSTTGVSPVTVIVSDTLPTRRFSLIVVVPVPITSTPSRLSVAKPDSVKLTE